MSEETSTQETTTEITTETVINPVDKEKEEIVLDSCEISANLEENK